MKLLSRVKRVISNSMQLQIREMSSSQETRQFEGVAHSQNYALYRPQPPKSLIDHIMKYMENKTSTKLALDIGCGSGQFTRLLPEKFDQVIGTDVSMAQVDQASFTLSKFANVTVRVESGEDIKLGDNTANLVSICQALHWLNLDKFYSEVNRVLVPGGVLAVLGYHFTSPSPSQQNASAMNDSMLRLYHTTGPYWTHLRTHVDSSYKTLAQPNMRNVIEDHSSHYVDVEAIFSDWLGYIRTWSGVQNMIKTRGHEEVDEMMNKFTSECADILQIPISDMKSSKLLLRTKYWITLYQK